MMYVEILLQIMFGNDIKLPGPTNKDSAYLRKLSVRNVGTTPDNLVLARQKSKLEANFQIDHTCQYKI